MLWTKCTYPLGNARNIRLHKLPISFYSWTSADFAVLGWKLYNNILLAHILLLWEKSQLCYKFVTIQIQWKYARLVNHRFQENDMLYFVQKANSASTLCQHCTEVEFTNVISLHLDFSPSTPSEDMHWVQCKWCKQPKSVFCSWVLSSYISRIDCISKLWVKSKS